MVGTWSTRQVQYITLLFTITGCPERNDCVLKSIESSHVFCKETRNFSFIFIFLGDTLEVNEAFGVMQCQCFVAYCYLQLKINFYDYVVKMFLK